MTKRITALLIAVIIPFTVILTGCGSKQLTPKEYYDELYATFKEYAADLKEVSALREKSKNLAEVQAQLSKAKELCGKAGKTLDKFGKMKPPSQFADKHKKLLAAVDLEKNFVNTVEKAFSSKSVDELAKYTKEAEAVFDNVPSDQQFPAVFMDLLLEVKAAL